MNFDRFPPAKFPLDVKICFQPQIVQTEARRCGVRNLCVKKQLVICYQLLCGFQPKLTILRCLTASNLMKILLVSNQF